MRWIFLSLFLASVCWAGAPDPDNVQTTPATTPATTNRVTVQKVAQLRTLTAAEKAAIDAYMALHGGDGTSGNQRALRGSLEFLVAIDQSHLPLGRAPSAYLADYQTFIQLFNRVDWYVNLPAPAPLPEFTPAGPAPPVTGIQLTAVAPAARIQPVPPVAIPVPVSAPPVLVINQAVCPSLPIVPLAFPKAGLGGAQPFSTAGVGTAAYASYWRQTGGNGGGGGNINPPPGELCPPGTPPTPPAPGAGNIDDPSGLNPGGCPPPTDPNQPGPPPDHGLYGPDGNPPPVPK